MIQNKNIHGQTETRKPPQKMWELFATPSHDCHWKINNPANTQRNKHIIITSKPRFGVIITCLLCFVFVGESSHTSINASPMTQSSSFRPCRSAAIQEFCALWNVMKLKSATSGLLWWLTANSRDFILPSVARFVASCTYAISISWSMFLRESRSLSLASSCTGKKFLVWGKNHYLVQYGWMAYEI